MRSKKHALVDILIIQIKNIAVKYLMTLESKRERRERERERDNKYDGFFLQKGLSEGPSSAESDELDVEEFRFAIGPPTEVGFRGQQNERRSMKDLTIKEKGS